MSRKSVLVFVILAVSIISMFMVPAYAEGGNIIKNPGLEEVTAGVPNEWVNDPFDKTAGTTDFVVEEGKGHTGKCYSIISNKPNDAKVVQEISVQTDKVYKVSCWIKTENIKNQAGSANISIYNDTGIYTSAEYKDTEGGWKQIEFYIKINPEMGNTMKFALRLGGQGTTNEGKASFDDVSMELVENPDASIPVESFFIPGGGGASSGGQGGSSGSSGMNTTLIVIVVIIVVIGGLVFVELKFSKRGKKEGQEGEEGKEDGDYVEEEESEEEEEETEE